MPSVHDRPFRFGLCVFTPSTRAEWVAKVRAAEELGYDVVSVSDHLGMPAPIPTLLLAAEATERIRIGTLVFNTSFYNPTVLARDIATVDRYSGGRVELGLGAGYDRAQFDAAGLPWLGAGERVSLLERTVAEFRRPRAHLDQFARFEQPSGPPILIAGRGERVLRLAAEQADIIAFTGTTRVRDGDGLKLGGIAEVTGRIELARRLLGDRIEEVELNIPIHRVLPKGTTDGVTDVWQNPLEYGADELAELPSLLFGTPEECADTLRERRKTLGLTYYTVLEPEMEAFAPIIEALR
ncbi:TIGR03621 family F420-dependent LLM class oxidoreductase [Nocardia abscessus]|uniref:TIGR03621 family F420-dependent LLM class oxidoreductase n=1 Tax=Nocardia abscessus TaxID=120957 RepID=UPI001895EE45|nr:TIGR03621 family F420-dependent LLM class oxidoreductase [Nocardia abscessus]MBF6341401.1 TIGR03621 family F420-dependent LLM class oxidoreductase [Nocardia abscessus]